MYHVIHWPHYTQKHGIKMNTEIVHLQSHWSGVHVHNKLSERTKSSLVNRISEDAASQATHVTCSREEGSYILGRWMAEVLCGLSSTYTNEHWHNASIYFTTASYTGHWFYLTHCTSIMLESMSAYLLKLTCTTFRKLGLLTLHTSGCYCNK
jgi:hypothetical protein